MGMREVVAAKLKLSEVGLGSWAPISSGDLGAHHLSEGSSGASKAVRPTWGQTISTSLPLHIAQGHLFIFRAIYSFLMNQETYKYIPAGKKIQSKGAGLVA